jgi:hypothetical protein
LQGRECFRCLGEAGWVSFFLPKFDQCADVFQLGAQSN